VAALACAPAAAFADPVATHPQTDVRATAGPGSGRLDPSVAIDPSTTPGSLGGERRVLLATKTDTGHIGVWRTNGAGTTWTTFASQELPGPSGVTQATARAAWGTGLTVFGAWLGRASSGDCATTAGVYLSTSTNSGATWGAAVQVAKGSSTVARGRPVLVTDASTASTHDQPLLATETTTWTGAGCTGTADHRISLLWKNPAGANYLDSPLGSGPGLADVSRPAMVAIPAALPTVAVAYLHEPPGAPATIEVVTCSRDDLGVSLGLNWDCGAPAVVSPPGFAKQSVVAWHGAGIPAPSAPEIAYSAATGSLHVVYAGADGGDSQAYYAFSDPTRTTWRDPVAVAGPAGAPFDQILPALSLGSVTSPAGAVDRADVVYLDRRDGSPNDAAYRAYATSLRCPLTTPACAADALVRGADVALGTVNAVAGGSLGTRMAAATVTNVAAPYLGHAIAYWPEGDHITESEVWHGLSTPSLPRVGADPVPVAKNTSTALDALFMPADADGDPVDVTTIAAPALGAISGTAYVAQPTLAGPDAFTLRADDGRTHATVTHPVAIVNQAPTFDPIAPQTVHEGGATDLDIVTADPDVADAVTLSLDTLPLDLAGRVTLTGSHLHIAIPHGARSSADLHVHVLATDTTTPSTLAETSLADISVTIIPDVVAPSVDLALRTTSGQVASLIATPVWNDQAAPCLVTGAGCRWEYEWDYADGSAVNPADADRALVDHTYAWGTFTPRVRVRVVGYQVSVPWSAWTQVPSGTIQIAPNTPTRLRISSIVIRNRTITVRVASHDTTTIGITVTLLRGGLPVVKSLHVYGTANGFGRAGTVNFTFPRLPGGVGIVKVGYVGSLSGGPTPRDPVVRSFFVPKR
jgi:hypothetical protein